MGRLAQTTLPGFTGHYLDEQGTSIPLLTTSGDTRMTRDYVRQFAWISDCPPKQFRAGREVRLFSSMDVLRGGSRGSHRS
jgi:hypothetical protein